MLAAAFAAILSSELAGCVTTRVNDIHVTSIEAVHLDRTEVIQRSSRSPDTLLLRVHFSTKEDLNALMQAHGPISNDAYPCSHSDREEVMMALSPIFQAGEELRVREYVQGTNRRVDRSPPLPGAQASYYSYLLAKHSGPAVFYRFGEPVNYYIFDLQIRPEDVCFVLAGGNYRKLGYKSNEVVIPAERLRDAILSSRSLNAAQPEVPAVPTGR
jgi:hypothetical protein